MPQFKQERARNRNGHKWRTVSGAAKRRWLKESPLTCHLCLHNIDVDAPAKSEWSLSVDHKIPVSVDPSLEYVASNLAPACWQCNVVRQDRPLADIQRDPKLFRREVELALSRRQLNADKKASAASANTVPKGANPFAELSYSRDWLPGWRAGISPTLYEKAVKQAEGLAANNR